MGAFEVDVEDQCVVLVDVEEALEEVLEVDLVVVEEVVSAEEVAVSEVEEGVHIDQSFTVVSAKWTHLYRVIHFYHKSNNNH